MVFCSNCGAKGQGAFCGECGQSLQQKAPEKELYTGTIRANDKEEWKYESGVVTCLEGNPKGLSYKWTGSALSCDKPDTPFGTWDGRKIVWRYPQQKEEFYTFIWEENNKRWKCESGLKRTVPNIRISYVNWKVNAPYIELEQGSDFKEGASTKWEISGDMPATHPIGLMVAMFSRAQSKIVVVLSVHSEELLDENIERSKRVYKRCGKLVLSTAGPTLLCNICANTATDRCISCDAECSGSKFQGKICKTCAPRKNFCIKCSDPLFGSKKEGFLCTNCGIGTFIAFNELTRTGKTSDNCAKMVFTVQ